MLTRYGTTKDGKRVEIARIYTVDEHGITRDRIDPDALKVTGRLTSAGHQAYIVGGAVRDLLLGRVPKDFDVATDATPRKVRKLFWNSRVIGRRFRLVHVAFGEKIIEVSTFRSQNGQNEFGTLEEDVARRDFTFNALYYSPEKEQILDYVGGYEDLRAHRLKTLLPIDTTFVEDPVRMVRAVKYSVGTGFEIPQKLKARIRKYAAGLGSCSPSRMTEEVFKILQSGRSRPVFELSMQLGVFPYMIAGVHETLERKHELAKVWLDSLSRLDDEIGQGDDAEVPRSKMILAVVEPFVSLPQPLPKDRAVVYKETHRSVKELIRPITPPNADVEGAVKSLLLARGLLPPPKPKRRRRGSSRSAALPDEPSAPERPAR